MSSISSRVVQKMILFFEGDIKRVNHALKVYGFARSIGDMEGLSEKEQEVLEVAAILHDIGIKPSEAKYKSSAGNYQEIEGPPAARELLKEFNVGRDFLERVCYLIGHHHTYSKIDGRDFRILVEADFLVNIYEDSISLDQLPEIKERYFRTETGKFILDSLYNKR